MKVQLHPRAEEELLQGALWYERRVAGLGGDLLTEVEHWLDVLPETPFTWPLWPEVPDLDPPVRRILLNRFPFAIAYQVFEDRIWVLTIAHTSRRPFYWSSRSEGSSSEEGPG